MVSGTGSRCASAGKLSSVAVHACSTHIKRACLPRGPEWTTWASGTAKWWEKLLGLGPRASLVKELGAQHNVTLQAFAHAACLVSQLPCEALQALQATHRSYSPLRLLGDFVTQHLLDTMWFGALLRWWCMHLHVKRKLSPLLYTMLCLLAVLHRL